MAFNEPIQIVFMRFGDVLGALQELARQGPGIR